jgi:transcriptional regulator with XRE-family HTH domain
MLAENLQVLRKQNHLSQEELAEKCQVSRQAIAKWERGESVPTIEKLIYLAGFYDVSLDELVGRIVVNKYTKIKEYLLEFAADDIPIGDDDDEICAIIQRYMRFTDSVGLSGEQTIAGLQEIFLHGCE